MPRRAAPPGGQNSLAFGSRVLPAIRNVISPLCDNHQGKTKGLDSGRGMWYNAIMEQVCDVGLLLGPVCYGLRVGAEVVYVGHAKNGLTRLYTHQYNWKRYGAGKRLHFGRAIPFDGVWVWPCVAERLKALEEELIERYKPRYNVRLKRPGKVTVPISLTIGKTTIVLNKAPVAPRAFERRI